MADFTKYTWAPATLTKRGAVQRRIESRLKPIDLAPTENLPVLAGCQRGSSALILISSLHQHCGLCGHKAFFFYLSYFKRIAALQRAHRHKLYIGILTPGVRVLAVATLSDGVNSRVSSGKALDWKSSWRNALNLFSSFKWVRCVTCLSEAAQRIVMPSGPFLVSRTGAVEWTKPALG